MSLPLSLRSIMKPANSSRIHVPLMNYEKVIKSTDGNHIFLNPVREVP